ncbi:Rxt3-domain-containing protein [Aspergillus heteromorphus CBS 117.55]|uniref:Rxt3-domain-containing protein n=1 Tax=Aspergillus heteromorphus CBS 117.55 TaxID=1448321 RepID=A0A317VEP8_9EURO|nr:Rxt3-domain-containing protein [Aspergillus heteromorphus CBS 117.55]PWY71681.1 Rxt3-domain-containing protein [Aspergillus heteromorphus CBS 117.55]
MSTPFLSREPPSNPAHHRPGSSMSISSMLGSDADRPGRDVGSSSIFSRLPVSSAPFGAPHPPSAPGAMSPPTAPARPSPLEYQGFRRSQTPEKSFAKGQPSRPYRSTSGGVPIAEQAKFGGMSRIPSSSQYPEKPGSTHPSPQIASAEAPYNETRRLSFSGPVPRPNSQPQHLEPPPRSTGYSPLSRPAAVAGVGDGSFAAAAHQRAASYMGHDPQHARYGGLYADRHAEEQAHRDRERAIAHEAEAKAAAHPPPRYGPPYGDREIATHRPHGPSAWELARSQPPSPDTKRFPASEPGSGFGFGAIQNYTKSLGSQLGGSRQPSLSVHPPQGQPPPPSHDQPPYLSKLQTETRVFPPTSSTGPPSLIHSASSDDQRRKGSDELIAHRNLLGVGLDPKRGGRASPLPQAVQGAQAQILGPSGDSGIKNELGRVFSGIGSGVGGVTATTGGSGPPTPMAPSPFKRDSAVARPSNGEITDETKTARPTSANGKRPRKSRDEETRAESEAAAAGAARGRRNRHNHHHHHHHHHHRSRAEEEAAAALGASRPLSAVNFFHRTATPGEGTTPAPAPPALAHHPHPHHHHHHHHHHHVPRPAAPTTNASATPMREPRTVVTIEPLLTSVAHLPRHHLGSTLYAPRIGAPTDKATLESAKFGYTTTPLPLPRFEGNENCTFTIRVPRFRIDSSHREEICARRALWGTGVYTDDSDPVAAAIHSGFIRGAWGDDVDVDLLDLEIKDAYQHAPKTAQDVGMEGERPQVPPVPPTDKDLHITLLVLPRLERYDSSVIFGLKSRAWERMHDGMSFKVLRVEWVDEGVGRGEERSGEARRKRLRNLMQTGRICTGPGVIKLEQLRNGVQIPRRKKIEGHEQPSPMTVS